MLYYEYRTCVLILLAAFLQQIYNFYCIIAAKMLYYSGGDFMLSLGSYLRILREERHLSLKEASLKTELTDSVISRIETSSNKKIDFTQIKRLTKLYDINIIDFLLTTELISNEDLFQYKKSFQNSELLTPEEHRCIQQTIDLLTKSRKRCNLCHNID